MSGVERLKAALREIASIAQQAEIYHYTLGASKTFAQIEAAALSAIEGGEGAEAVAWRIVGVDDDIVTTSTSLAQEARERGFNVQSLGVIATPPATPIAGGFGSSSPKSEDTHRAAETAVVGGQIAWRVGTPPQDGSNFYGHWWSPCRWLAYKPNSEQSRRGVKGRWQTMNEFGGWVNASAPNEWATEAQIKARQQAATASDTTSRYEPEASEPKDAARRDEEAGQ